MRKSARRLRTIKMMRLEDLFRPTFSRIRAEAEAALREGREGEWSVCPVAWVRVGRVHLKALPDGTDDTRGPVWELESENAKTAPDRITGEVPTLFQGCAFDLQLSYWEASGPAQLADVSMTIMETLRQAGLTKDALHSVWDEALVNGVMVT